MTPRALAPVEGAWRVVFLAAGDHRREPSLGKDVLGGMVERFLSTGRYTALPLPTPADPAALPEEAGAHLLVILGRVEASLDRRRHHVHRYLDGSASAEATLQDPSTGEVLAVARARSTASARSRYSSPVLIKKHLAERLAEDLARGLLYERRGEMAALEDPGDGSLRRGIESARRGEWEEALRAWREAEAAGRHPRAARRNIAEARRVLDIR